MRDLASVACLSAGALAMALPCEDGFVGHWLATDGALAGAGALAWARHRGDAAFPAHLATLPAIVVATLAGMAQAPHCFMSVEAELAGRLISGCVAAYLAWAAARALAPVAPGPASVPG